MEKRTLYAVVVAVLLGIGAYAVLGSHDKGERTGPKPRPVPVIKAAELTKLEITTQKDENITLEKKGTSWRITAPIDSPADGQAMKALTEGIDKLTFGDIVTENIAKHADMQVADKGSVHLKITAGGTTHELILGTSIGGYTMLRLPEQKQVWQANNLFTYLVNKPLKDWREHLVAPLQIADVSKLSVSTPGGSSVVLEVDTATPPAADGQPKKPPVTGWKVVASTGDAPKAGDALDGSQPGTVLQALQSLRAADFVDEAKPKEMGLEPPTLVVTATTKEGEVGVEIGGNKDDDFYVRKVGEPTIYLVKKYMLERLSYPPIDYRDKRLLSRKGDEIARIDVVQGKDTTALVNKDGNWELEGGGPLDKMKVNGMVGGAETLVATHFVTDKSIKTELDKPRATVTLTLKAGGKELLKVGGVTKDQGDYYVMVEGPGHAKVPEPMQAKKFAIDRLLRKPADLAPTPKPAPGAPPPGVMPPHGGMPPH